MNKIVTKVFWRVHEKLIYLQAKRSLVPHVSALADKRELFMMKTEKKQMVWMELNLAVVKCCEEDHIGSVTRIYNSSGTAVFSAEYDPWGVQTVTTNTIGYRSALCDAFIMEWRKNRSYCGHEMLRSALWDAFETTWRKKELDEETGLYYYGARYYDPRLSLWLGTDPMQEKYPGISTYAFCHLNPIKMIDINGKDTINLLPPSNVDSRTYALMMDINHFNDDPSVINIWAHGNNYGIKDDSRGQFISNADDFYEMLQEHSEVWRNRENDTPVTIVLHSCETSPFAAMLSRDKRFNNVTFIAPKNKLLIRYSKGNYLFTRGKSKIYSAKYLDTGIDKSEGNNNSDWYSYKNGVLTARYSGSFKGVGEKKPGSKGFTYNSILNKLRRYF